MNHKKKIMKNLIIFMIHNINQPKLIIKKTLKVNKAQQQIKKMLQNLNMKKLFNNLNNLLKIII